MSDALPDQLGEFHITGLLGEGTHGTVYAAERELAHSSATSAPRRLALRVLRADVLPGERQRKLFLQEATLLAAIDHPGIVKVFGFGVLPDDRPYLATERLEGETLAARLEQGALPAAEAFALFAQLGEALAALHARGLLHRDVKPENVFLTYGVPYGAGEKRAQAVLFDFGITRGEDAAEDPAARGTPAYMAPERRSGAPASIGSEVYELAVTLYAMLCARLPWPEEEEGDGAKAHLHPLSPSKVGVALPAELEGELMRALSPRADKRPASVRELSERVAAAAVASGLVSPRKTLDVPIVSEGEAAARLRHSQNVTTLRASQKLATVGASQKPATVGASQRVATVGTSQKLATVDAAVPAGGPDASSARVRWPRVTAVVAGLALAGGVGAWLGRIAWRDARTAHVADAGAPHALAEPPLPASGPRHAAHTSRVPADVATHHPRDSAALVGLSWTQVLEARPARAALAERAEHAPPAALAHVMRVCGFDPLAELEWISLGVGAANQGKRADLGIDVDVIMAGRWNRDELEPCLTGLLTSTLSKASLRRDGRLSGVEHAGKSFWLGWLDEHTFIASTRSEATRAWIEARLDGKDSADAATLAPARKRTDGAQTLWLIARPNLVRKAPFARGAPVPAVIEGGLRLDDELHGEMRSSYDDPRDAAAMLATVQAFRESSAGRALPTGNSTVTVENGELIVHIDLDASATAALVRLGLETLDRQLSGM